ncbi:MAG TPA: alpha/beta hydrolase, partial [Lysinibacillus sp.]|nr:alpha/beta hydrolase [Lysinibacillus sp.]
SWVNHIVSLNESAEIVLYGVSMGGATVMMASGENLPTNVKAIIEDCGYSSVWDEFSYQLKAIFHLPAFPIMHFSSVVTKLKAGYTLGEASAVEQVAKSKTPMLFIHGDNDTFVPSTMLNEVYEAANVPKQKLIVEGAGHGGAESVASELYWATIQQFLESNMK